MTADPNRTIEELIAASSLGTPEAVALRATVSDERAAAVVARSKQIAEENRMTQPADTITVYVTIGNSDDKLSQSEWAHFYAAVAGSINMHACRLHGRWLSPSDEPWQNACWCIEIEPRRVDRLRRQLAEHAVTFGQDSIAWAEAPAVEFLRPTTVAL